MNNVRVRFAPSPTGHLHIGSLRAALFNWLFARHHKGVFLLRIEDTDNQRSKQEYVDSIFSSLAWVDLLPDEPFIIQSDRIEVHKELIAQLIDQGKAYRCICMPSEVKERQKKSDDNQEYVQYDGFCRDKHIPVNDVRSFVVRFALPRTVSEIVFDDIIRGRISFAVDQLDDFIIARSDGRPMYNFVVVVDDEFMGITHVIRGEDHISNTPKQILLYQSLGYTLPRFAHVPLILGHSGERLSKRDAATSVEEYRQMGYLPDALLNYLVRLGWSHGNQEIFTRDELIRDFSLEAIGKKNAIFDKVKLDWVTSIYLRDKKSGDILEMILQLLPLFKAELEPWSDAQVLMAIDLYKERSNTLVQLADEVKIVHDNSTPYNNEAVGQWVTDDTAQHMQKLIDQLSSVEDFDSSSLKKTIKDITDYYSIKFVSLAQPIRIALTGKDAAPGVYELLLLLGKDESIKRLKAFLRYVKHTVLASD